MSQRFADTARTEKAKSFRGVVLRQLDPGRHLGAPDIAGVNVADESERRSEARSVLAAYLPSPELVQVLRPGLGDFRCDDRTQSLTPGSTRQTAARAAKVHLRFPAASGSGNSRMLRRRSP
jgi:hypothetical protein